MKIISQYLIYIIKIVLDKFSGTLQKLFEIVFVVSSHVELNITRIVLYNYLGFRVTL